MQKWEYCAIYPITNKHSKSLSGNIVEMFKPEEAIRYKIGNKEGELSKYIAELGLAGWEMTSSGSLIIGVAMIGTDGYHVLYFKRPIEE